MIRFDDLTLATTVHNNAVMSAGMLHSCVHQVGSVAQIVVVDDASATPFVPPHLDDIPIRVLRNETALGFCKASDRALREVQTRYALLVDADVLFQPGDFAGGYREFQKGNWAWVNFRQISFSGTPQNSFEQPLMPPWVFAAGNQIFSLWEKLHRVPVEAPPGCRIVEAQAVHSSCTLVDLEAFRAIGGFDPWYAQCQSDIEISLRFRARGFRVGVDLGYEVKHEGAGGKSGSPARVLDLYRARVHLYERAFPVSRFYLRPLLFVRHALELAWFAMLAPFGGNSARLQNRVQMLKGALSGYQ
ncbi:MAG: glycosyltransferase family 2 protein [Chthoniobacterales bacterium]